MASKKILKTKKVRKPRKKKGLRMVSVRLHPDEHDQLRHLALEHAVAAGSLRPDVSALVRVAVSEWLAKKKGR